MTFPPMLIILHASVPSFLSQLEFSDDITRIIQTAISSDGGQPESRKANSMVKSFFIRVRTLKSIQVISFPSAPLRTQANVSAFHKHSNSPKAIMQLNTFGSCQLYAVILFSDTRVTKTLGAFKN